VKYKLRIAIIHCGFVTKQNNSNAANFSAE